MAKSNLAVKSSSNTTEATKEFMAYFSHYENSLIVYRVGVKGGKLTNGRLTFKVQDIPNGLRLLPVHPLEELKELTE